jgi:plastocyanin
MVKNAIPPILVCFLFASNLTAQTVTVSVSFSEAAKSVVRRSPYGKPPVGEQKTEKRLAAIWIEGEATQESSTDIVYLDQRDIQFDPRFIVIRQGEKVRVRNSDPVYHNVFSLSSVKKFDIGRRQKGAFVDVVFDKTGVVQVFCDIHSNMNAEILVVPKTTLFWKMTHSREPVVFSGLAPGTYKIKAYAPGFQEAVQTVTLKNEPLVISLPMEVK